MTTKDLAYIATFTNGRPDDGPFDTSEEAVAAIAEAMQWADPIPSDSFAAGDGSRNAFCVYETQEECDEDEEGSYAPRVVEVDATEVGP